MSILNRAFQIEGERSYSLLFKVKEKNLFTIFSWAEKVFEEFSNGKQNSISRRFMKKPLQKLSHFFSDARTHFFIECTLIYQQFYYISSPMARSFNTIYFPIMCLLSPFYPRQHSLVSILSAAKDQGITWVVVLVLLVHLLVHFLI